MRSCCSCRGGLHDTGYAATTAALRKVKFRLSCHIGSHCTGRNSTICIDIDIYIYIFIYYFLQSHTYVYIYICMGSRSERVREREREGGLKKHVYKRMAQYLHTGTSCQQLQF